MMPLVRSALAHPRAWLLAILALTVAFALALPRLELRTDGAALYPRGAGAVARSAADRSRFHDPQQVILLVSARAGGPRLDSRAGLLFLKEAHTALAALHGVRGSAIQSVGSLLDVESTMGSIAFAGFLDALPADSAAVALRVERLRREPLANGLFLASAGQAAAIYVPLAANAERGSVLAELETWIASRRSSPFELRLLGPLVAEARLGDIVLRDLARLVPLVIGAIALLLALSLRSAGGVLVPLLEALLVLVWTFGAMALCRVPLTLVTTIVPVVLMAVAITDEIHLLERVQSRMAPGSDRAVRRAIALDAMRHVHGPIVAASITTGIGFLSFWSASIPPLRDFGIFTGLGIGIAMLLSFTLVPALIAALPARFWTARRGIAGQRGQVVPPRFEMWAARRGRAALWLGLVLLAASIPGVFRLQVQDAWVDNFDPRSDLVTAEHDFNHAFWGSYRFDLVVEAERGFFYEPEGVALVQRLESVVQSAPHVGGVLTHLAPMRQLARALGEERPLEALPRGALGDVANLAQMAQERTQMLQLATPDGDAARLRVFVNSPNYARARALRDSFATHLGPILKGKSWHTSGDLPVALEVVRAIVDSQLRSIGWTLAGIAVLLLLTLRSWRAACVAMLPVTASAVMLFGGMGYAGVPLGIATSMFASLSIGVGIEFALYILHEYRDERAAGRAHAPALEATLARSGRAIRWNALVLAAGMLVLTFSALRPDRSLGVLLAAAVLACYATTLLFMPELLRLVHAKRAATTSEPRRVASGALLGILLLAAAAPSAAIEPAHARPPAVEYKNPSDPDAERIMLGLEKDFRRTPRLVRMQITSKLADYQDTERTLWAVLNGDRKMSRVLYIFTRPDVLRGTSLLVQDDADPRAADSTWFYFASIQRFRYLDAASQKMLVPGTALTTEDARGFIPIEKYDFAFATRDTMPHQEHRVAIVARPKTDALREYLGYAFLVVRVDTQRRVVEHVDYTDLGGKLSKTYDLLEAVRFRDSWMPRRVRLQHLELGFESDIDYEYWPIRKRVDAAVFRASVGDRVFLDRLLDVLKREGVSPELAGP